MLARKDLAAYINNVQSDQVAIGFGDVLSNKGAVSISFCLGKLRLCFINCHLAPHDEGVARRNQQWNKINDRFVLKTKPTASYGRSEGAFEPNYGMLESSSFDKEQKVAMIDCKEELPPIKKTTQEEKDQAKVAGKKAITP